MTCMHTNHITMHLTSPVHVEVAQHNVIQEQLEIQENMHNMNQFFPGCKYGLCVLYTPDNCVTHSQTVNLRTKNSMKRYAHCCSSSIAAINIKNNNGKNV